MVEYDQLEELSIRISGQVIELVRTMTPDKTEQYTVKNFFSASNSAGGHIRAIAYNTGPEFLKKRINAALEEVCKALYCLDMLNQMAVVEIACYEKVTASYKELARQLSLALNSLNVQK